MGAMGALLVMTVLSTAIGVTLPALLPRAYTHYASAALVRLLCACARARLA